MALAQRLRGWCLSCDRAVVIFVVIVSFLAAFLTTYFLVFPQPGPDPKGFTERSAGSFTSSDAPATSAPAGADVPDPVRPSVELEPSDSEAPPPKAEYDGSRFGWARPRSPTRFTDTSPYDCSGFASLKPYEAPAPVADVVVEQEAAPAPAPIPTATDIGDEPDPVAAPDTTPREGVSPPALQHATAAIRAGVAILPAPVRLGVAVTLPVALFAVVDHFGRLTSLARVMSSALIAQGGAGEVADLWRTPWAVAARLLLWNVLIVLCQRIVGSGVAHRFPAPVLGRRFWLLISIVVVVVVVVVRLRRLWPRAAAPAGSGRWPGR